MLRRQPTQLKMVNFPPPTPINDWDSDEEDGIADQTPLAIDWVNVLNLSVAISSLPGNRFAGARRSLVADIETLKEAAIQDIFLLCTDDELRWCKVGTMVEDYRKKGFTVHHYPMAEEPSIEKCMDVLEDLHSCLLRSRRTLIHCVDGLGRSCLVIALLALYISEDLSPFVAIELVRRARGAAAIQTIKQYYCVLEFRKNWADHTAQQQYQMQS